jgi:hypothetical protein
VFSIEVRLNTLPKKQIQLLGVVCNILFGSMELHLYPHNFLMLISLVSDICRVDSVMEDVLLLPFLLRLISVAPPSRHGC